MVVQSRLFKGLSDPLDARMPSEEDDGRWKNPTSEIEDVEWEIFVGLVEFAYTGDYWGSLPGAHKDTNDDEETTEVEAISTVQTEQPESAKGFLTKNPLPKKPQLGPSMVESKKEIEK